MRTLILVTTVLYSFMAAYARGETNSVKYFVQLILVTDTQTPPSEGARRVGPTLSRKLSSVLCEKNYWEIKRQAVDVQLGRHIRCSLSQKREVEIGLSTSKRIVTAFYNGQLVERHVTPRSQAITLIGDNHGPHGIYFTVVRRDKPGS